MFIRLLYTLLKWVVLRTDADAMNGVPTKTAVNNRLI